jgi:predicted enzyme related to lactoylglutathione lyase
MLEPTANPDAPGLRTVFVTPSERPTVEDPDASAARATEFGGTVVMPPFEAGPVRMARRPAGRDVLGQPLPA